MSTEAVLFVVVAVGLIVLSLAGPRKRAVGGVFKRDRKGRMTIVLTPLKRKRKRW